MNLLDIAIEITSEQYMDLLNPVFEGQSRLDSQYRYWMVFSDNGILYKIHCSL